MATTTVTLVDGFKIDDRSLKVVTLKELTALDITEARAAAERPVETTDGWRLLVSDTMVGVHLLCRQIASIDDHNGPLSVRELSGFTERDFALVTQASDKLSNAVGAELTERGRGEPASHGD